MAMEDEGFVETVTREEGNELFRRCCLKDLNITPEEFLRRYREQDFDWEIVSRDTVIKIAMLLPFWSDDE